MRRANLFLVCLIALAFSAPAFAKCDKCAEGKSCPRPQQAQSPDFDFLKSLQGSWKGSHTMNGKKETGYVRYRVTSGGSAVEETLFPGTPNEMVSIYTLQNGKVEMVHYCMMGNQPRLKEQSFSKNQLVLNFTNTPGINPKKDTYMGGLTLTLKDPKHLEQKWSSFENGKPGHVEEMSFVRAK